MRDKLLIRLLSVLDSGDREAVLSVDTARLAAQLIGDSHRDLTISQAVGMYHWKRYLLDRTDTQSMETALGLLTPVVTSFPERIPEPLRSRVLQAMQSDSRQPVLDLIATALKTGERESIDEAIAACRLALDGSEPGDAGRQGLLANLSTLLLMRYHRYTAQVSDMREAVTRAQEAIAETPPGHRNLAIRFLILGDALLARYTAPGDPPKGILDEAREAYRRALEVVRPEDARREYIEQRVGEIMSALSSQ